MPEYWIQIENHPWDAAPRGFDRMMGMTLPADAHGRHKPVTGEALILRRMTPGWAGHADQKVNPWDLNEPDPTQVGTIPGPTLECNVGEKIIVHFKNADARPGWDVLNRTHSLHPHGITFQPRFDGAYPLTPPDPDQPVGAESALWSGIGVGTLKMGDRVPPGGTFTYTWDTHSWPTTAGVWLYHDHSVCDARNVGLGAIGFLVIHNTADPDDVVILDTDTADLPGGSRNGSPIIPGLILSRTQIPAGVDLLGFERVVQIHPHAPPKPGGDPMPMPMPVANVGKVPANAGRFHLDELFDTFRLDPGDSAIAVANGNIVGHLLPHYRTPPARAQYLLLLHELAGVGFCINGRIFMGNTPTLFSGPATVMRFGVVGMGDMFHTFHLHGHRWTIPGPDGTNRGAIQASAEVRAVSQFEDTRIFGPANSFSFTIHQGPGQFMGADPDPQPIPGGGGTLPGSVGEWHMHCHVLAHMETGMMGSLLIRQGGEVAGRLPSGQPCPPAPTGTTTGTVHTISIRDFAFDPPPMVLAGDSVQWHNTSANQPHTASADGGAFDTGIIAAGASSAPIPFTGPGVFPYHCNVHPAMTSSLTVM